MSESAFIHLTGVGGKANWINLERIACFSEEDDGSLVLVDVGSSYLKVRVTETPDQIAETIAACFDALGFSEEDS